MRPASHAICSYQVFGAGLFCLLAVGCKSETSVDSSTVALQPNSEVAIRMFCGNCHAFPEPDTYPSEIWPEKVREGFKFYYSSLRTDLDVPSVDAVEDYYVQRAPVELLVPATNRTIAIDEKSLFSPAEVYHSENAFRAIAHLNAIDVHKRSARLAVADMRTGNVWLLSGQPDVQPPMLLTTCLNACHVEATDLDADGTEDFVVADLGSFLPEDHDMGAVWFVRASNDGIGWQKKSLIEGLGRVADVRPLDADGDGDTDLIVAEFGWHATGKIMLLRNSPTADGQPQMTAETIDQRHGAIHVPVTDLNGDGYLDFVALISQEHEAVEAFVNRGDGTFERHTIFQSDNPGFGSCGIQLADMDNDGDIDVAYVNGDSLDTPVAKPYHSVCWFENRGTYPFAVHEVAKIPGGYCIRAGDIDADGDADLAVVTLLPGAVLSARPMGTFDSVVWFEQTEKGSFIGHSLERDNCLHAACELIDWDLDGDLDLLVGDMAVDPTANLPLTIYRNTTNQSGIK